MLSYKGLWTCHMKAPVFRKSPKHCVFLYMDYTITHYIFMKSNFSILVLFINFLILLYLKQIIIWLSPFFLVVRNLDLIPSVPSRNSNQFLPSPILHYQPINSGGGQNGEGCLPVCERSMLNGYLIPAKLTQTFIIILGIFKKNMKNIFKNPKLLQGKTEVLFYFRKTQDTGL